MNEYLIDPPCNACSSLDEQRAWRDYLLGRLREEPDSKDHQDALADVERDIEWRSTEGRYLDELAA
ncbi:MAG: hypothetical protein LBE33_09455 [Zoogloeaceae bacterium]|jgi:hypothetical protein|nr:hypothetical protein [Zoogloeaceae bacterium]